MFLKGVFFSYGINFVIALKSITTPERLIAIYIQYIIEMELDL